MGFFKMLKMARNLNRAELELNAIKRLAEANEASLRMAQAELEQNKVFLEEKRKELAEAKEKLACYKVMLKTEESLDEVQRRMNSIKDDFSNKQKYIRGFMSLQEITEECNQKKKKLEELREQVSDIEQFTALKKEIEELKNAKDSFVKLDNLFVVQFSYLSNSDFTTITICRKEIRKSYAGTTYLEFHDIYNSNNLGITDTSLSNCVSYNEYAYSSRAKYSNITIYNLVSLQDVIFAMNKSEYLQRVNLSKIELFEFLKYVADNSELFGFDEIKHINGEEASSKTKVKSSK